MNFKTLLLIAAFFTHSAFAGFMPVANVSKIQGKATIKISGRTEKLKEGQEIADGMELSIPNAKDFVEVKFQNGHVVRFKGATVKVEDLTPKSTLLTLIKGKIFSVIKPLSQGETFGIKTRRAAFAVRGTKFFIEESKKNSYLCVCEGVVNTKTAASEVDVKKDEDLTVANAKGELKARAASQNMIDMSNSVFKEMGAN